jgi:hypothetical protein
MGCRTEFGRMLVSALLWTQEMLLSAVLVAAIVGTILVLAR